MGTPYGVYYIQSSLASNISTFVGREGELYTYTSVGLSALLVSTDRGNAKAYRPWNEQQAGSTFSFLYIQKHNINCQSGSRWLVLTIKTMKAVGILCVLFLTMCASPSFAQISKKQAKERKVLMKPSKSELTQKATKEARKEAKKLCKEGWTTTPGALPIEKQLDKAYMMSYEYDDNMFPKYIMGEAMSIGENYDAAKMQALELAKQNLAGQIQTEVTALVENTVANKQLSQEQAASVTQSIMASKNLISQSIGRTIPVMEVYRTLSNKNKEVLVRIAYNSNMAKEAAKKIVREDLEKKGDKQQALLLIMSLVCKKDN